MLTWNKACLQIFFNWYWWFQDLYFWWQINVSPTCLQVLKVHNESFWVLRLLLMCLLLFGQWEQFVANLFHVLDLLDHFSYVLFWFLRLRLGLYLQSLVNIIERVALGKCDYRLIKGLPLKLLRILFRSGNTSQMTYSTLLSCWKRYFFQYRFLFK